MNQHNDPHSIVERNLQPPAACADQAVAQLETFAGHEPEYSRLLYMLQEHLDTQIILADTKANLVLGANAILLATWELKQGVIRDVLNGNDTVLDNSPTLFALLMIVMVLVSGIFALRATLPRIRYRTSVLNPFFFGHIIRMTEDNYVDTFMAQTADDFKTNILRQIHAKSLIAQRKFLLLRISMVALIGAFAFWIASQLAQALTS